MCREYYAMRAKLAALMQRQREDGDDMAITEIRLKMDAHVRYCPTCQENMRWWIEGSNNNG
jgi:hypothetical protein